MHRQLVRCTNLSRFLALVLCPPSIGMMAVDNAPLAMQSVSAFLILLENAALYGLIGAGLYSMGGLQGIVMS